MVVIVKNHTYRYDMENISEIFFPYEKIKVTESENGIDDPVCVITEIRENTLIVDARVYEKRRVLNRKADENTDRQNALSVMLYKAFSEILGITYPWGLLYGVRPARRMHALTDAFSQEEAKRIFREKYLVSDEKIRLVCRVMSSENKIIAMSRENSFSLYVSIPFCPTRCSYCSFVSHSIENAQRLVEPYVELLVKEIEETGVYAKALGLRLESVYFGGGTPTVLGADMLSTLFEAVEKNFDLGTNREYTVEAGRPDTVTADRLKALKSAGVSRISINPQTFSNEVLEAIGRRHSAEETLRAFSLAREQGFDNINMDFIAGLPKDDIASFENSIKTGIGLGAESVTVHTLSLKSGAYMATREAAFDSSPKFLVSGMLGAAESALDAAGYSPYYMYRQGKSLGNHENVGWCKSGRECLYNVFMMDETHTVLAVGAGAVIKLKNQKTGKIKRIYNYKYPYEYIDRFDEILRRKKSITDFFGEYNI